MLLLLDNCEHVIGAAAALADHLLARCPRLTILATSREPLGVPGEAVRPLDPLPDPMALRLLAERGAAARPGFRTDADEATAAACAEICRRLDGLPLAIELAAARLRMLTPRQIADRLDDRFRLLSSGSRTVLPRQQTLRAVVDWSWDLLDAAERAVLRRLSVFAGGCSLAAAEEVCALPDPADGAVVDALDVAGLLGSLVDKSLVVAAPGDDGEMRYGLLETVGEYAAERLAEADGGAAVARRHLVHYRELARTTGPKMRGANSGGRSPSSSASTRTSAPPSATPSPSGTSTRGWSSCCRRPGTGCCATCARRPASGARPCPPSAPTPSPRPASGPPRSRRGPPTGRRPWTTNSSRRRGAEWPSSSWPARTTRSAPGRTRRAGSACGSSRTPTGPACRRPAVSRDAVALRDHAHRGRGPAAHGARRDGPGLAGPRQ